MNTYQPNPKNTVTMLLQVQEHEHEDWGTVSTATAHVDNEATLKDEIERCRANWQYSGVFTPSAKWRIMKR
jgi:hypothetical protein